MYQLNVIFLASAIFAFSESAAIIDKVKKCSLSDDACMQDLYKSMFQEMSDNGIPEMGVPKLDPLVIKDKDIVALAMIQLTMKEGEAKGFKNCYVSNVKNNLETLRSTIDFECDVFSVEGSYKIESTPILLALIGDINIHGEGKGAVVVGESFLLQDKKNSTSCLVVERILQNDNATSWKLSVTTTYLGLEPRTFEHKVSNVLWIFQSFPFSEKVHLSFDFAFEVKKLDDGELHILFKPDDSTYDYEVKGKTTFSADNVLVGKQEISAVAVNILNENWEYITKTFGKIFIDKALELFYEHAQQFLSTIPAKDLITDDFSSYVKS